MTKLIYTRDDNGNRALWAFGVDVIKDKYGEWDDPNASPVVDACFESDGVDSIIGAGTLGLRKGRKMILNVTVEKSYDEVQHEDVY